MVDRSYPETEAVDRVAKAIDEAVAKWQPGSGQRIHEMVARAAIEAFGAAQTTQQWMPIETVPKNHFVVLVYGRYGRLAAFRDINWDWWPFPAHEALDYTPTHWMPMPAPPALSDTSTDRPPQAWLEAKAEVDAGWPDIDPFNRKQVEAVCRAVCAVEGVDPDDTTWTGDEPPWTRYADAVAVALADSTPERK